MAHLVESTISEDKDMDVDDATDARFASILHSRSLVSKKNNIYQIFCSLTFLSSFMFLSGYAQ